MCQEQADISLSQKEKEIAVVGIKLHHSLLHHPDVQQKAEAYLGEAWTGIANLCAPYWCFASPPGGRTPAFPAPTAMGITQLKVKGGLNQTSPYSRVLSW